jgi:hypothetical protein
MAYRFTGSSSKVQFSPAALAGKTFGATTLAILMRRAASGANHEWFGITTAGGTQLLLVRWNTSDVQLWAINSGSLSPVMASTSIWYLLVCTRVAGATVPRYHIWDGTSWTHTAGTAGSVADTAAVPSDGLLAVGDRANGPALPFAGDIVACGIKNADTSDAGVMTLSPTSFATWKSFGFDWLVGFEAAGTIVNRSNPGVGDETSRAGVSLVADPPGWSWTAAAPKTGFLAMM